jgi:hypothetical protein
MFVWTNPPPGAPRPGLGDPLPSSYKPPINKGGQPVDEKDGKHLLTILAGPSPYQIYLARAMANAATTVPGNFLRIVTSVKNQVPRHLQGMFTQGGGFTGATIDRWTRTIYAQPAPGLRMETRLEYALHEAVHLFADPHAPAARSCPTLCIGTFQRTYGRGLGEGTTQVITEDVMDAQGISRYYRDRPYDAFTPPVREIIKIFTLDTVARAYFFGDVNTLTAAMDWRWGPDAWRVVARLTSQGDTKKALDEIKKLEAAHVQRFQLRGPKGDFPSPSRTRMYA